ncbi:MAG TPA: glycosyltransferase family 2 protein [Bryobacteraceae bacterium]|nr:glycosyltransferase family 2 protein [Bryobacteraceae bacterium]
MPDPTVCVSIVTYNNRRYIRRCLDAVLAQSEVPMEVIVVDNGSDDGTRKILRQFGKRIRVIWNSRNEGFAAAQNQAIRSSTSEWVLTLNPDVLLKPGFIANLVGAGTIDPGAGAVCGKLLSIGVDFAPLDRPRLDSTGIYFTPQMRHFDRGWGDPADQSFEHAEYVFGASAAAALYRRRMIDDIAVNGDFFDSDFFAYREDADVAWRAQLLGWPCIYTPAAVAYHVRTMVPGKRRSVSGVLNMHSVKNRFLMRVKNTTPDLFRRFWLPMTLRDLVVVGACFLYEPRSLEALWRAALCARRAFQQRRHIMSRRVAGDGELARWFNSDATSVPLLSEQAHTIEEKPFTGASVA